MITPYLYREKHCLQQKWLRRHITRRYTEDEVNNDRDSKKVLDTEAETTNKNNYTDMP